jgi:glycosyltransferase involved in cell wall biosynthesis
MISVVMPVYNAEAFLAEAIQSILDQSWRDFEFIIANDGSTDGSCRILERYAAQDRRIRVLNLRHANIVVALNQCIEAASRTFLARMDADDIALPKRLEIQLDYLRQTPDCVAVGSSVEVVDPNGLPIRVWRYEETHDEIDQANLELRVGPRLSHPAVMMRTDVVKQLGGYREHYAGVEDWDLWLRLAEAGRLANLPDVLLKCRQHLSSASHQARERQRNMRLDLLRDAYHRRHLEHRLGELQPSNSEQDFSHAGYFRTWGWWALEAGNLATARKYAIKSLVHSPWTKNAWDLTACAFLAELRLAIQPDTVSKK